MFEAVKAGTPDALEQFAAAEDLARVPREEVQQLEFALGQAQRLPAKPGLAWRQLELQGSERTRGAIAAGGRHLRHATQQGTHARCQLEHRKRLGQVVVGAKLQAQHALGLVAARAEHDDGHVAWLAAQVAADVPAAGAGQHQVQQHQIEGLGIDAGHGLATVGDMRELVAGVAQMKTHHVGHGLVVFHQQ